MIASNGDLPLYAEPAVVGAVLGVVAGGVVSYVASFLLDRTRRAEEREVRREQWERDEKLRHQTWERDDQTRAEAWARDEALRRRDRMFDVYTRVFAAWHQAVDSIEKFGRDFEGTPQAHRDTDRFKEEIMEDSWAVESYCDDLTSVAAELHALAPLAVLSAFEALVQASTTLRDTAADYADFNDLPDPYAADETVKAYNRFRMAARDDLDHDDFRNALRLGRQQLLEARAERDQSDDV